jgi:hypothetical protein
MIALFVREARVSMALSHQNIVPVFDFGRADDALFLAMELVDGRDLGAVLARARDKGEVMDPLLVAFVGAECCAALAYAHARAIGDTVGVVHRDVTPRNILVSWAGEVRLTDFGVAALRSDEAVVRGTPGYMAPEQARGEEVDNRADLYALGMVLREAATGTPGRPAAMDEALAAARTGTLPPLPELPGGLGEVIARATANDPAERFHDARVMRDALDRVVAALRGDRSSPSHLLTDWMRLLFGAPRDDEPARPTPLDAVTFLDDGEAAVVGSATARSLAGTADELGLALTPAAAPPEPVTPSSAGHPWRWIGVAVAFAAIAAASAVIWLALPDRSQPPVDAAIAPDVVAPVDARVVVAEVRVDAAPPPPVDAAPPPIDAPRRVRPVDARPPRARPAPDAAAATPGAKRKVTIGARPWAVFYVDGDPTPHETPETVELRPGRHRIRFVNERAHVDKTIVLEVPEDRDIKHVEELVTEP